TGVEASTFGRRIREPVTTMSATALASGSVPELSDCAQAGWAAAAVTARPAIMVPVFRYADSLIESPLVFLMLSTGAPSPLGGARLVRCWISALLAPLLVRLFADRPWPARRPAGPA